MSVVDLPERLEPVNELHTVLGALIALRDGDASVRLPYHWSGVAGRVADAFNDVVERNAAMAEELSRLRQVVGRQGKLKQRASLRETLTSTLRISPCGVFTLATMPALPLACSAASSGSVMGVLRSGSLSTTTSSSELPFANDCGMPVSRCAAELRKRTAPAWSTATDGPPSSSLVIFWPRERSTTGGPAAKTWLMPSTMTDQCERIARPAGPPAAVPSTADALPAACG